MKKSIFLFFAAILCAIGASAATKTIYFKSQQWWHKDGAASAAYYWGTGGNANTWPGTRMTKVAGETNVWSIDIDTDKYQNIIFTRVNGSGTVQDWGAKTEDLVIPTDDKNFFTLSTTEAWDGNKATGTWSVYTPTVTHTFAKNSTLYVDFRAITDASKKGANYPKAGSVGIDYSANAGGTVIPVTFTADVKWAEGTEFIKTDKGGWASIPFKAPEAGQNCAQVAADGKSYTWTVYSEPSVTLSLDKTQADAGTNVTVTLTATADNVSGEVTYAFQYSTDNATWNNITATGNTATQTFAAETRYYKVTMTNGGTTKEATAKFSAIKFHIIGSWDSWAAHNEVVEGSKTITLEANKTYEYKITNGTWDLSWGNDGTMDRNNCTDWSFESNNNAKIKTDEAGDYVFNVSRNAEGKVVVSVTYPELSAPIPTFDYYIAGNMNGWDKAHVEYGMTDENADGIYEKEITLAAGQDHQFKVTNGKWGNEDGGFDCATVEGSYEEVDSKDGNVLVKLNTETTFTVKFNKNTSKITFEGLTEKAPVVSTYALMGVGGDWTTGITMTVNPDNADEYVLKAQSISSTDAIKVRETAGSTDTWHNTVDAYSNATFELVDDGYGDKNIVLPAGTYNFYFKKINNQIYIEEVYVRDVTNTYGTICLPYASNSYDGAIFYRVAGKETGKVYLESVSELEAGVPYIFEKTASKIVVARNGAPVATAGNANGLVGTFTDDTPVAAGDYILYDNQLRPSDGTAKVNANRAYLVMSEVLGGAPQQMPGRRYIGMSVQGENEATGFENIVAPEGQALKVIENGQLIIIRGNEKFNAQGVRL